MKTFQFEVVGAKFRAADFAQAEVTRGDRLTLKPEPTNQYDPLAIAVYKGETHIGYVPRTHNKDRLLHEALKERPQEVGCCVDAAWKLGCWVVVNIKDDNEPTELSDIRPAGQDPAA